MSQATGIQVVTMRRSQFAAARQMLTRAFVDYPLMKYVNADEGRRRRGVSTLYAGIVRDTLRYGEIHVSAGIEGASCWLPPGVGLPTFAREVRAGMLGLPLGFGWAGFQRLVDFDHVQAGLERPSVINCDGLHTVTQASLTTRIGAVGDAVMGRVCTAISYALGC